MWCLSPPSRGRWLNGWRLFEEVHLARADILIACADDFVAAMFAAKTRGNPNWEIHMGWYDSKLSNFSTTKKTFHDKSTCLYGNDRRSGSWHIRKLNISSIYGMN